MVPRLTRLRDICLQLPEVAEVETWGLPTFRVRNKIFVISAEDAAMISLKADADELDPLLADERFTPAPYLGRFGWVSMVLAGRVSWGEVDELVRTSYALIAPRRLARLVTPD